jgi:hypothetical protein
MPIRIASRTKKIAANGLALHRAKERGVAEDEAALTEERRLLKEERDKLRAQALLPGPTALDKLVRTHHPEAKSGKARKDAHTDEAKKPKARRSRAEKHAEKAAAVEAARHSHKAAAKKPAK